MFQRNFRKSCFYTKSYKILCFKDIIYLVLWLLSFFSSTVVWNGERYKVGRDGKMVKLP